MSGPRILNQHGQIDVFTSDRLTTSALPFTSSERLPVQSWTPGNVWLWARDANSSLWLTYLLSEIGCTLQPISAPQDILPTLPCSGVLLLDVGSTATATEELALLTHARAVLPATVPILMIGQQTHLTARMAAIRAGAQRYLVHPIPATHLLHTLAELLAIAHEPDARIALVGDNTAMQQCQAVLAAAGVQLHHEPDPHYIFTALAQFPAEVIIVNAHMADGCGCDLAAVVRSDERYSQCGFIVLDDVADQPARPNTCPAWRGVERLATPVVAEHLLALVAAQVREVRRSRETCSALTLALRGTQAQMQALNTHVIISITDRRGQIIYVNDNFCRLTGYSVTELLGQTHHLFSSGTHDNQFYRTLWHSITNGHIWRGEICNRSRHGELFWVMSTIVPLVDSTGQPYAYMAMRTDVTPLKRQSEQLRWQARALEAINNGVTISDARLADMPLVYVNPAFERITGYTAAEVLGRNCRFLQGDEGNEVSVAAIREALQTGAATQVVLRNYRKDGSAFWNDVSIAPVRNDDGDITHYVGVQKDITETLQTQDALRAERDFIQATLAAIPSLFYVIDQQLRVIEFNTKLAEITGLERDVLKQCTAPQLFAPEQRADVTRVFTAALLEGSSIAQEFLLLTTNGAHLPVYLRAEQRQINGSAVLIGTGQDMSAYHYILTSLRVSEERLSRSQSFANIGVWDWQMQTNALFCSENMTVLLGGQQLPPHLGMEPLFELMYPHDRRPLREAIAACIESGAVCDAEFRIVLPDGGLQWLLLRGNVVHDDGEEPVRMLGVIQDVSRLKQAEMIEKRARREIKAVIDSLCALICVIDAQGVILSVNRSWRQRGRCFTLDNSILLTGNNYLELHRQLSEHGHADSAALISGIRDVLTGSLPGFEIEIGGLQTCDDIIYLVRVTPLQGATESEPRVVVTHQDITATRQIEADLRHAKEVAERASQAKSEFLSSMSHELRTPMNAVLGFAQLLEYDVPANTEQYESVQEILRAGRHLLGLINDILDLARIEAGKIDLTIEPVIVATVVDECRTLLTPVAEPRGVQFVIGDLDHCAVFADHMRLKQVIINLCANAIKYNRPQGQVKITLEHRADRLRLLITDTGPGIAPEHLDALFQPFTRLVNDDSPIEGTGIGLAVCQRLMEAMHGQIGVTSTLGQGSQFWIELPSVAPQSVIATEQTLTEFLSSDQWANAAPPRYTILQIEDNPANLKLMERIFARRGDIRVLSAPSATLGLELAHTRQPAAILMDINMPGMDGYAALAALRADPLTSAIPVIALTANATANDIEHGLAAGFDAYLVKPLDLRLLVATLERLLDS